MPATLTNVRPCKRIWDPPGCDAICRFPDGRKEVLVPEPWATLEEVLRRREKWEIKEEQERKKEAKGGVARIQLQMEDEEAEEEEDLVEEGASAEVMEEGEGRWEKVW